VGRLLGAAVGAGLAGAALAGGVDASKTHDALLIACAVCVLIGIPASTRLGRGTPPGDLVGRDKRSYGGATTAG
jgi:hypothetical protein